MDIRHLTVAVIFALTLATALSADIEITCIYKPDQVPWAIITTPKFVTCELQTDLKSSDTIGSAIGTTGSITNAQVKVFVSNEKKVLQIPEGLETVFEGLEGIKFDNTGFKLLNAEKLKALTGLKYLGITNGEIDVIFADTFKGLAELILIDLSNNPIMFIGPSAFSGNANLNNLYLDIGCLDGENNSAEGSDAITILLALFPDRCDMTALLETFLFKTTEKFLSASESSTDCEPCGNEEECTPEDCTDELNALNSTLIDTEDKLDVCNKEIDSLNATNLELNQKIEELEALTSNTGDGTCGFKTVANVYSCYAKISVKTAAEQTVNWNGTHASDKNNDAVLSMVIYSQTVEILPLNIGTVFKNLISLAVKNSGLTKIKAGDFKTLTKLETLEITGNNITTIDATAFSGLTKLIKLDLSANKITVLPSKVFDTLSLSSFKILDLSYNVVKVRYDIINAANTIEKAYFKNNTAMEKLDRTFIWRLQKAKIIDLEGTGCDYSLDKTLENPVSFMSFYSDIVTFC